jgi:hypothetical protein
MRADYAGERKVWAAEARGIAIQYLHDFSSDNDGECALERL